MALLLRLEDFNAEIDPEVDQAGHSPAKLPGYDLGFEAGQAAIIAGRQGVDAALIQTLNDMAFGFAEAQQHTLNSLAPLFHAIINQLLPNITDDAFRARLLETLQGIAQTQIANPVRLIVHPDQMDPVARLLDQVSGIQIDLHHDAEVGEHGALISHSDAEFALNLDDLTAQMKAVLAAPFEMSQQKQEA